MEGSAWTTMISPEAIPLIVALLALVGVLATVAVARQKNSVDAARTTSNERSAYLASVQAEVSSLRIAEQFNDTRITDILGRLQQAQLDILTCQREKNDLSLKVADLEAKVAQLQRRLEATG